jgi:hypothetical protein
MADVFQMVEREADVGGDDRQIELSDVTDILEQADAAVPLDQSKQAIAYDVVVLFADRTVYNEIPPLRRALLASRGRPYEQARHVLYDIRQIALVSSLGPHLECGRVARSAP